MLSMSQLTGFNVCGEHDPYWDNVVLLCHFEGSDGSTTMTDVTGKTWTVTRNAQIDSSIAKFGQSLQLSAFTEGATIPTTGVHLHMTGATGSSTFNDALQAVAGETMHAVTANGGAAISTAQSVFNGSSLRLDGTNDYLSVADVSPAEFDLAGNAWTISLRVRFDSVSVNQCLACCVYLQATPYKGWVLRYDPTQATPGLRFVAFKGDAGNLSDAFEVAWTPSVNTWYAVEVTRSGNSVYFFVGGTLIATKTLSNATTISNAGRSLLIGAQDSITTPNLFMGGYMQEFRLLNGLALHTASYTVPTEPYPSRYWGDMVDTPTDAGFGFGTGDFTVEAQVYLDGDSTNHVVFDTAADLATAHDVYGAFYVGASDLRMVAGVNGTIYADAGSDVLSTATFHHVAWVRESGVLTAFLDGATQWSIACTADMGASRMARIGHSYRSNAQLAGRIDELRITKGVARYTSNFTPPTVPFPNS